jgi:hypothetical protein
MSNETSYTTPEVLIEVQERSDQLGGATEWIRVDFTKRADELGSAINEIAEALRPRFDALSQNNAGDWALNEISLQFSVSMQAEAGVVIARASSSAAFQASLTWARAKK